MQYRILRFVRDHHVPSAAILSCAGMALLAARFGYSPGPSFRFMPWNLALAWIPFCLSVLISALAPTRARPLAIGLLVPWLLFLPNAPYLVTDLVHLKPRAGAPLWYDVALLAAFGGAGMYLGAASLEHVHRLAEARFGWIAAWASSAVVLALSGFAVYLGRFLRWNSWDPFTNPLSLLADLGDRVLHPMSHPQTLGVALIYGGLFGAGWLALRWSVPPERVQ